MSFVPKPAYKKKLDRQKARSYRNRWNNIRAEARRAKRVVPPTVRPLDDVRDIAAEGRKLDRAEARVLRRANNPKPVKHIADADLALPLRKRDPPTISMDGIGNPRGTKYVSGGRRYSIKQLAEIQARHDRLCKHGVREA